MFYIMYDVPALRPTVCYLFCRMVVFCCLMSMGYAAWVGVFYCV